MQVRKGDFDAQFANEVIQSKKNKTEPKGAILAVPAHVLEDGMRNKSVFWILN